MRLTKDQGGIYTWSSAVEHYLAVAVYDRRMGNLILPFSDPYAHKLSELVLPVVPSHVLASAT